MSAPASQYTMMNDRKDVQDSMKNEGEGTSSSSQNCANADFPNGGKGIEGETREERDADTDRASHSRRKLREAADSLRPWLQRGGGGGGGDAPVTEGGRETDARVGGTSRPVAIRRIPCRTEEETRSYRCRCNFQVVPVAADGDVGTGREGDDDDSGRLCFAVREGGIPVPIEVYPIANRLIQRAMKDLMDRLNHGLVQYSQLRRNLTSASFSSSWADLVEANATTTTTTNTDSAIAETAGTTCLVTLHYNSPIQDEGEWKLQAFALCRETNIRQLTGRSKKRCLRCGVAHAENEGEGEAGWPGGGDDDDDDRRHRGITDTVLLHRREDSSPDNTSSSRWTVSVQQPQRQQQRSRASSGDHDEYDDREGGNDGDERQQQKGAVATATRRKTTIAVHCTKPEGAFYHPNATVMCQALQWMLNRIDVIAVQLQRQQSGEDSIGETELDDNGGGGGGGRTSRRRPCMLEMYCGCGAHTVALARSNLLESIVAVELDDRLVDACVRNCAANGIPVAPSPSASSTTTTMTERHGAAATVVNVRSEDAAKWARSWCRRRRRGGGDGKDNAATAGRQRSRTGRGVGSGVAADDAAAVDENDGDHDGTTDFNVLLVDPPRQGLDERVCAMAVAGTFRDVLYVSCGREALVRDLDRLSLAFYVADCTLLDLFPRTASVESLVHLRRRQDARR